MVQRYLFQGQSKPGSVQNRTELEILWRGRALNFGDVARGGRSAADAFLPMPAKGFHVMASRRGCAASGRTSKEVRSFPQEPPLLRVPVRKISDGTWPPRRGPSINNRAVRLLKQPGGPQTRSFCGLHQIAIHVPPHNQVAQRIEMRHILAWSHRGESHDDWPIVTG
jgi:hypothetical protein